MLILLQWLIGLLYISNFLRIHESTPSCDSIKGYENIDTILAILSSFIALYMMPYILFVCGKILIPGEDDRVRNFFQHLVNCRTTNSPLKEPLLSSAGSFNFIF
jgi:hypothetical protein